MEGKGKSGIDRAHRSKIIIIVMIALAVVFIGNECRLKVMEKTMPPMEDMYFVRYRSEREGPGKTSVYRYDAEENKTYKVGSVEGYFHNCEIDNEGRYITGLRNAYFEGDSGEGLGVVRFSLEDKTAEVLLGYDEIRRLKEGNFSWRRSYPVCNGQKILLGFDRLTYILYDLRTEEWEEFALPEELAGQAYEICELRENAVWYKDTEENVVMYNLETGEKRKTAENVEGCKGLSDDGTKLIYMKKGRSYYQRLYLYDIEKEKESCICRTHGAGSFSTLPISPYGTGWSKNGEYFLYEKSVSGFVGSELVSIRIYNVRTGRSRTFYREWLTDASFEFVRNAD